MTTNHRAGVTRSRRGRRGGPLVGLVLAAVTAASLHGGSRAGAQPAPPSEYAVKAAYLYNFTRYVEWPPAALVRATDRLLVCVLGEDPFGPMLERTMARKSVNDRQLEVRRCATVAEAARCHVVFVAAGEDLDRAGAAHRGGARLRASRGRGEGDTAGERARSSTAR